MVKETKMETAGTTAKENTRATISAAVSTGGPRLRTARYNVAIQILARQTTVQLNADVQILKPRTEGNALSTPERRPPNR